jgi:hypothetical protein
MKFSMYITFHLLKVCDDVCHLKEEYGFVSKENK